MSDRRTSSEVNKNLYKTSDRSMHRRHLLLFAYLSIVPCTSTTVPGTSNLNWSRPNTTIAAATFARFDADGRICVYTHRSTHLVVDVQGYLADAAFDDIAVDTAGPGFLQVHDCAARPGATSNLNYDQAGTVIAGLAVARFGADGTACVFMSRATHLVVDVQGHFADGALDDIVDIRVLDTRID